MKKQPVNIIDSGHSPNFTIIMLAWPIFIEQVLLALVKAVDTAMVGSLGKEATAAVAINYSPNMVMDGVMIALGIGFTSLVARSVGARDLARARNFLKQGLLAITAIGLALSIFCFVCARKIPIWMGGYPEILDNAEIYNQITAISILFRGLTIMLTAIYRGYGDSKSPMIINVLVNGLNVIGNFLMIYPTRPLTLLGRTFTMFGFGWGVAGAAVSTALSGVLGGVILLIMCFTKDTPLRLTLKESYAPDPVALKAVLEISVPTMLERFFQTSAFLLLSRTVATLGTAQLAAHQVAATAESLSFMPGFAFGTAVTTLFGQSIGAKRTDLAHDYVVHTLKMGTVTMALMTLVLFLWPTPIISLFTPDAEVIRMGSTLLRLLALIQIPQMAASVYSGALKGAGDAKSSLVLTLSSIWGVRIAGIMFSVYVLHLGLYSICVCMDIDNVVRWILFHLRYRQGKWKQLGEKGAGQV